MPHESHGEEVKAFVILTEGATVTEDDLVAWGKEKMAAYKYPRIVEFVDALPDDRDRQDPQARAGPARASRARPRPVTIAGACRAGRGPGPGASDRLAVITELRVVVVFDHDGVVAAGPGQQPGGRLSSDYSGFPKGPIE